MEKQQNTKLQFSNKQILAMLIPLILEHTLGLTVGIADSIMVTRVSEAAVSGVSLVDSINVLMTNLLFSLSTGGVVITARAIGQKNKEDAQNSANQLLLSITLLATVLMVIALFGNNIILKLIFGQVEYDVMRNARIYFYITSMAYPFLAVQSGCTALCRATGNTKITMYASVLTNIVNVSANAFFLYVMNWEAAGVAAGTLMARIVGASVLVLVLLDKKKYLHITNPFKWHFDWYVVRKILGIGIPTGVDNSIFQVGKIIIQSLVASFGTAAIAANALVGMVGGLGYIPGNNIGIVFLTVIGQLVGAEDYESINYYMKKLMKFSLVSMAVLNIMIMVFAKPIISVYNLSAEGASMAYVTLMYHSVAAILLWSFAFVLPHALRAATDARFTMIVSISSMWFCRIGFSYLLGQFFGMGLLGVWVAMSIDWLVRSFFFIRRIKSGKWLSHIMDVRG